MTPAATWMTIPDAAALLGCSTRTVERKLAAGKFDRQEREGRVLVAVPDTLRAPADRMVEAVRADASQMRDLTASIAATAEQSIQVMRATLDRADAAKATAEARAAEADRRARRFGWACAGLAATVVGAVAASVSVGMDAARSRAEARQLAATASDANARAIAAEIRAEAGEAFTAFLLGTDTPGQPADTRRVAANP